MINEAEAKKAGIDLNKLKSIHRRLTHLVNEIEEMGIEIFGGSGLQLRFYDYPDGPDHDRPLVIADVGGSATGGDGGHWEGQDGLMRGE